jgi:xanthine dehydrogenase molybdopterin-binding subunit B
MEFPINPPIGERVRRKETERFITGTGRYVDDLLPAGTLHVSFVRSSCAHARIKSIDVTAARTMPGVRAVYTGAEIAKRVKPLRVGGSSLLRPVQLYPLAVQKVRYFSEPLAAVVADNRYLAEECGYCTPGMLMSAYGLLSKEAKPTEEQIKKAISGNLCRCTGYGSIVAAIKEAAEKFTDRDR